MNSSTSMQYTTSPRLSRIGIFVAPLIILSACAQPGQQEALTSTIRIGSNPVLQIGVVDGDTTQEFQRIGAPFVLPDGRIAIPDAGANRIRVFGSDGTFEYTLGRPGIGPDEFRWLISAWPRGDTIEALDNRLRKVVRFLPDGTSEVVPLQASISDLSAVSRPAQDGWIVGGVSYAGMGQRDQIEVYYYHRDGTEVNQLAEVEGMSRYAALGQSGPEPLSPRAILAAHDGLLYVAETLTPLITIVNPVTNQVQHVRIPTSQLSVDETLRSVMDSAVARVSPDQVAVTRQRLEAAPRPERISQFWSFLVDATGLIWIRPYDPFKHAAALGGLGYGGVGAGGTWKLLSAEGVDFGNVELPSDIEPVHIGRDSLIGIHRNALGVEFVRIYRIERM